MMAGRSGGTWLAMNKKTGKIAVLLNILQPKEEIVASKRGRGFIVNDFVSGDESCHQYLHRLAQQGTEYNGFQAIALQIQSDAVDGAFYSNSTSEEEPQVIEAGIHGYGNSIDPKEPWPKVTYGQKRFQCVLDRHSSSKSRDQLIEDLFDMMMDKRSLPVDQQMKRQGHGREPDSLRKLSALCVEMPEAQYGSR